MRHRKRGRTLGRSASHRRALLRNLASSLLLTERDAELDKNAPKTKGRIVTTLQKAKEVRPLIEKCITIARRSLQLEERVEQYATDAERGSDAWREWRQSDQWRQWCDARAPGVAARRRALRLLGSREAVQILFDDVAPRFADRHGGYTRILKLAEPRVGDAGIRAILEFVGVRDRVVEHSEKPAFSDEDAGPPADDEGEAPADAQAETPQEEGGEADEAPGNQPPKDES